VNASMTEFAKVFESQETHEQIARHHKRITGFRGPGSHH
jgi:hypothetical protein